MKADGRGSLPTRACRWALLSVALLLASTLIALLFAGRWLAPDTTPPEPADFIIVLAGSYDRTLYAADLYARGLAPRVVVSRPVSEPIHVRLAERGIETMSEGEMHRRILTHLNVPESAIDFLPGHAHNTRDEAVALARYLNGRPTKAIVVTSPYHTRRASIILWRRLADGQQIQVVPTPYEEFDWRWWQDPASARAVLLELAKVIYLVFVESTGS